jgi:hypothetical protein
MTISAGRGGTGATADGTGGALILASGNYGGDGTTGTVGAVSIRQAATEKIAISTAGAIGLTGNTTITGTAAVTGAVTAPVVATVSNATDTITAGEFAGYYGKTVFLTKADGAIAIAMAADGVAAGTWVRFIISGANHASDVVFTSETADTLITFNDIAADSVTFGAGHRTGAKILFISDGTSWIAINESNNTMTVQT